MTLKHPRPPSAHDVNALSPELAAIWTAMEPLKVGAAGGPLNVLITSVSGLHSLLPGPLRFEESLPHASSSAVNSALPFCS